MHAPVLAERPRAAVDEDGAVEGYASLFGEVDQARDVMLPGAFRDTLRLRGLRRIPMLFQHDPAEPIGIWLELTEDFRGLYARGRLIPDVARAREILALVRAGAIDGLSIGFRTSSARVDPKTKVRRVAAVDLWEISIVTFPLLNGARVRALKGMRFSGPPYAAVARPAPPKLSPARSRAETDWRALFGRTRRSPDERSDIRESPSAARGSPHVASLMRATPLLGKYRPDQPRVPAGNHDGGQWTHDGGGSGQRTSGGGGGGRNDPRLLSDATPETLKPGARYAQLAQGDRSETAGDATDVSAQRRRGGSSGIRINGQEVQGTLGQQVRYTVANARAQETLAQVRQLDPAWRPRPGVFNTSAEGAIAQANDVTFQAQARLFELTSRGSGGFDPANLQSKVQGYLLDPNHAQNRGKADWFRQALGFDKSNWQELAAQIRFDQSAAVFERETSDARFYRQPIAVTGANGRTIDVLFAFQRDRNGVVSLVTGLPRSR